MTNLGDVVARPGADPPHGRGDVGADPDPTEGVSAAGGAVVMLLVSPLGLGDLPGVLDETQDVLLVLLGMVVLTHLVKQAGGFERLAAVTAL